MRSKMALPRALPPNASLHSPEPYGIEISGVWVSEILACLFAKLWPLPLTTPEGVSSGRTAP